MRTVILTILTGLAGGLAVGASVSAFITVLGLPSFIVRWSRTPKHTLGYQVCLVLGGLFSCLVYFTGFSTKYMSFLIIPLGFLLGIFVGMVAAALTETFDIITIVAFKLKIAHLVYLIILFVILGKIGGSLFYFLIPSYF
ncbi:MAG: stage V sporulation protein AB [Caldicoprobacterales bacterium]|nr:hypothetical protein [Clostridiales bacterium]